MLLINNYIWFWHSKQSRAKIWNTTAPAPTFHPFKLHFPLRLWLPLLKNTRNAHRRFCLTRWFRSHATFTLTTLPAEGRYIESQLGTRCSLLSCRKQIIDALSVCVIFLKFKWLQSAQNLIEWLGYACVRVFYLNGFHYALICAHILLETLIHFQITWHLPRANEL